MKVALVGNPNTGKSTLFNALTGLNQRIGNFPGVTVEKKIGHCKLADGRPAEIIDLPGCYSLYPKSKDEAIVFNILSDRANPSHPDIIVFIADSSNLKRNLLFFSQVADLGIPIVLALNMIDLAKENKLDINVDKISEKLGVQVIPISARKNENIEAIRSAITNAPAIALQKEWIHLPTDSRNLVDKITEEFEIENKYAGLQLAHHYETVSYLTSNEVDRLKGLTSEYNFQSKVLQTEETLARYSAIDELLAECVSKQPESKKPTLTDKIDSIVTHRFWGYIIFFFILLLIFQAIFSWAEFPMLLIENFFAWLDGIAHQFLPAGPLTDLMLNGVLAGLGGVLVFIPQIAILFGFIAILEDTGYMSRITFLMDKLMRKVGLNGKSIVPMVGGLACAVPSIMAARSIENWKDRIITIMVTPLISCAARLPVYTILIALVVPDEKVLGFFDLRGLTLMGLYLLGAFGAVFVAWVMKLIIKNKTRSYFIMELPIYRMPRWKDISLTIYDKVKTFVFEVGKIIIAISIVLWVMASFGPPKRMEMINAKYDDPIMLSTYPSHELEQMRSSEKLENSYVGLLGKAIEPAIRPLGFDWKIGIALITSLAAREVFVGTMATIYSVEGSEDDTANIREMMTSARNPTTGELVYTTATAFSLMVFYAFAMQCMSTIAVVKRETQGWKWPMIQLGYMTAMAYLASLLVYQLLK